LGHDDDDGDGNILIQLQLQRSSSHHVVCDYRDSQEAKNLNGMSACASRVTLCQFPSCIISLCWFLPFPSSHCFEVPSEPESRKIKILQHQQQQQQQATPQNSIAVDRSAF